MVLCFSAWFSTSQSGSLVLSLVLYFSGLKLFDGSIDDVRLYSGQLLPARIVKDSQAASQQEAALSTVPRAQWVTLQDSPTGCLSLDTGAAGDRIRVKVKSYIFSPLGVAVCVTRLL